MTYATCTEPRLIYARLGFYTINNYTETMTWHSEL